MKFEIEICDDNLGTLAQAIADKLAPLLGTVTETVEDDDDLLGGTGAKEVVKTTLKDVQDAIQAAVTLAGKAKVKEVLAKFKVKAGSELAEEDYDKFIAAVGKLKK